MLCRALHFGAAGARALGPLRLPQLPSPLWQDSHANEQQNFCCTAPSLVPAPQKSAPARSWPAQTLRSPPQTAAAQTPPGPRAAAACGKERSKTACIQLNSCKAWRLACALAGSSAPWRSLKQAKPGPGPPQHHRQHAVERGPGGRQRPRALGRRRPRAVQLADEAGLHPGPRRKHCSRNAGAAAGGWRQGENEGRRLSCACKRLMHATSVAAAAALGLLGWAAAPHPPC